jgi:membrane peptidoglycan carboxypeptidase
VGGPGAEPPSEDLGRPGVGRANVGRASVRPVSPGGPGSPTGPGGPAGSSGPRSAAAANAAAALARVRGLADRLPAGARNPFGRGKSGDRPDGLSPSMRRRRKARRRNILIASFAVFIMLAGVGVVGGTYYVDNVKFSQDELTFPETTQIYYSDGPLLAKLGETTRYALKFDDMTDNVKQAIVASEDNTFWTNEGVDFGGVLRAAWNNFTGGDRQGGSTITQQYARLAFDLSGSTYERKGREAVLAWKISDKLSKQQILEYYLNSVPFGRNTYGIEAAAQAFFGKTANKTAPPEQQITTAEAMLLVLMVKQPNPDPADPKGSPGYDPTYSPEAAKAAQLRWDYVHGQMIKLGYLKDSDKIAFPTTDVKKYDPNVGNGLDTPAGLVINHVLSELVNSPGPFQGKTWQSIRDGGYKIYTTLDSRAQAAAEAAADPNIKGSQMFGQPATLQAAMVAVQPGTGRVLAYYGGQNGTGSDFAGIYKDEDGKWAGFGDHPAGSSFKVYTLAAALKAGISLNSYWQWTPHDMPGRIGDNQIRNASKCPSDMDAKLGACSLLESTTASLNTTFYGVTVSVSPAKVLDMARNAGIEHMWSDKGRVDFTPTTDMSKETPENFDTILGIGQYPVTVADHANGMATFAANGIRAQAHFVYKVMDGDQVVFGETLPASNQQPILQPAPVADLDYALSTVTSAKLKNLAGWQSVGKTGTWEANQSTTTNAHAWMVGYTKKLAAAVWVGNQKDEKAIRDKSGGTVWGSGIPSFIWQQFITNATKAMGLTNDASAKFPAKVGIGDENPPGSIPSPTPPPVVTQDPTTPPTGLPGAGGLPGPGQGNGGIVYYLPTTTRRPGD